MAWPTTMNNMLFSGALVIDTILVAPLGASALAAMGLATAICGLMLAAMIAIFQWATNFDGTGIWGR
ncbi:MAG: hypothetical protein OIF54_05405 [Cohaesibacter sp.]|nr:hypothetical protein [Cohaesibacter sp.]